MIGASIWDIACWGNAIRMVSGKTTEYIPTSAEGVKYPSMRTSVLLIRIQLKPAKNIGIENLNSLFRWKEGLREEKRSGNSFPTNMRARMEEVIDEAIQAMIAPYNLSPTINTRDRIMRFNIVFPTLTSVLLSILLKPFKHAEATVVKTKKGRENDKAFNAPATSGLPKKLPIELEKTKIITLKTIDIIVGIKRADINVPLTFS